MKAKIPFMFFKFFKTIRAKLLFSFAIIFIITCVVIGLNLWFTNREERLGIIVALLADTDRNMHILNKLEKDFLSDETINVDFYRSGHSDYLHQRTKIIDIINSRLDRLAKLSKIENFDLQDNINLIKDNLLIYNQTFGKLYELIRLRGFKDYGLEGQMRESIHALEESPYQFNMSLLLMARRHEKDFMLRKDEEYASKNISTLKKLEADIDAKVTDLQAKREMNQLIVKYRETFLKLINVEKEIGFDNQSGIKRKLKKISDTLFNQIDTLNQLVFQKTTDVYANINYAFFSTIGLYIVIFFIFAFFITQSLSLPISNLSDSINAVIDSNFDKNNQVIEIQSQDEIGGLAKDFQYMLSKVQESIEVIKAKSDKIEEKQKLLMKSLEYAKQIQNAILPDDEDLNNCFAEYFALYLPKDVVSGDFYWINRRNDKLFVAMVDCTGHGVPGAFMSMIGHTLLNKIVTQSKIYDPAIILEVLHLEVKEALKQENHKNDDGMDVALCLIESDENNPKYCKLTFAGAKSKLFYTQHGELRELRGTKRSIGGGRKSELRPFENQEVILKDSEIIYLFTDGLIDQQNEEGEKYGKSRLKDFLDEINHLPLQEQYGTILVEVNNFAKNQIQRDDITLLGFRI
ncbi:MAG: SpoIIE family protein phosphatase [Thermoflexibacter sp.]|jgi:serine phosphatase RsbU (regulator of sigma subunit)|nr:SpoIIE family protein phosphatase [Thermoflexibacter sp.]